MIVGMGDNNTLLLAIVEDEIGILREGRTLTFEGTKLLVKDIVVCYAKTKTELHALLKEAGIPFSSEMEAKHLRGERTDHPRKDN